MRYLTNLGTEDAILVLPSAALYPRIIFLVLPFQLLLAVPSRSCNRPWAAMVNGRIFMQISWALGSELSSACALVTVLRAFAEGHKVT